LLKHATAALRFLFLCFSIHFMNADSRSAGKGSKAPKVQAKKRREVVGKAAQTPKRDVEPFIAACRAPDPEPPKKLDLTQVREMVLDELAAHALAVARNLGQSAKSRRARARRSGQASADAKWLLDTLLTRIPEPAAAEPGAEGEDSGEGSGGTLHDLADQRRELIRLTRNQRAELNK
jgi:hypothetical protein